MKSLKPQAATVYKSVVANMHVNVALCNRFSKF